MIDYEIIIFHTTFYLLTTPLLPRHFLWFLQFYCYKQHNIGNRSLSFQQEDLYEKAYGITLLFHFNRLSFFEHKRGEDKDHANYQRIELTWSWLFLSLLSVNQNKCGSDLHIYPVTQKPPQEKDYKEVQIHVPFSVIAFVNLYFCILILDCSIIRLIASIQIVFN